MFGTMVIQLPSKYEGGGKYHHWKETEFNFSGSKSSSNFYFTSFYYADCEYRVKPVTKGYRLVLSTTWELMNVQHHLTIRNRPLPLYPLWKHGMKILRLKIVQL